MPPPLLPRIALRGKEPLQPHPNPALIRALLRPTQFLTITINTAFLAIIPDRSAGSPFCKSRPYPIAVTVARRYRRHFAPGSWTVAARPWRYWRQACVRLTPKMHAGHPLHSAAGERQSDLHHLVFLEPFTAYEFNLSRKAGAIFIALGCRFHAALPSNYAKSAMNSFRLWGNGVRDPITDRKFPIEIESEGLALSQPLLLADALLERMEVIS